MNDASLDFPFSESRPAAGSWLDRRARKLVLGALASLAQGRLRIVENGAAHEFGVAAPGAVEATVSVRDPRFFRRVALGGSIGAAESYMDGDWSADDLPALIRIMARNESASNGMEKGAASLFNAFARLLHALNRNTRAGSRRNIEAHYDLGNDFYRLFLDPTMSYSSAVFPREGMTLEEGSIEKIDMACRKLGLRPGERLLEIGTGWGSLAIHAAKRFGCQVLTTTLSRNQRDLALERVRAEGLQDRIQILMSDYRDLDGAFDKIVSIEMIEAVGHDYLPAFFGKCAGLLKPEGLMLIQGITIPDQKYDAYRRESDFIRRYIFPGGSLPSIGALCDASRRASDFRLVHLDDYGEHYAETLRLWREAFLARLDEVRSLGHSDRFIRMWEYYLAYCEGGFRERSIGLAQFLFARPQSRPAPIFPSPRHP